MVEVLTKEETLAAIREATAPLLREIQLLKDAMEGEQVSRKWAEDKTGVTYRTFEARGVKPHKHGSRVTYSKLKVLEYIQSRRIG